eukprot:234452-Prorocentrum_minimum.AAC.4
MSMPPSRMRKTAKDVVAVAIPNMPYVYIIMHMYIVSPTTAYLVRAITPEWAIRRSSGCCWGCETGARVYCVKRRVEIMSCGCTSARYTHASIHTRLWCNSLCPKGLVSKHWYMHFHRYHSHRTYLTDLLALYTKTLGQYYVHSNGTCDRLTRLPVDKTGLGGSQ